MRRIGRKIIVFLSLTMLLAGMIPPISPTASAANTNPPSKAIQLNYSGNTTTAPAGFYSNSSSLTPSQTSFDLSSYGVDTSQVVSVTMTADKSQSMSASCTKSSCSLSSVKGKEVSVTADESKSGSFAWWRNGPGWHPYWWSYDLENGSTTYANPEQGNCSKAPCEYPGGTYPDNGWSVNFYNHTYTATDPLTNGPLSVDGHYVSVNSTATVNETSAYSKPSGNATLTNSSSGEGTFNTVDGPFDVGGGVEYSSTGKGITWYYGFTINFTGTVYVYPSDWTIKITYKKGVPTVKISATCPANVKWDGTSDVTFSFTAGPASISNLNAGVTVTGWRISAYSDDGNLSNYDASGNTSTNGGSKTWNFTVPASTISGISKTVKMNATAIVYLSDGTSAQATDSCQFTISSNPTPAATPTPTPVSPNPPPTAVITGPDIAKQGQQTYVTAFGSHDYLNGTELQYQWYYWFTDSSGAQSGPIILGGNQIDDQPTFANVGKYWAYVGVTDKWGGTAHASKIISVLPPKPDAAITASGQLKEKREITLDGSGSSSPASYPIVSRAFAIAPMFGENPGDIITAGSLNGTQTVKVMFKTYGIYKASYTVTNSAGYTSTASMVLNVVQDLAPVAVINVPGKTFRDPNNGNMASFALDDQSYSPDGDQIGFSTGFVVYDSNNDGNFTDETNSQTISINRVTVKGTFTTGTVGKYQLTYKVCETFDAGVFNTYITAADFKCSEKTTQNFEVDNIAPTTSLSGSKIYKTDIAVDIGNLSNADKNQLINNLPGVKTQLTADNIDASITTKAWNTLAEPLYAKDANNVLTMNQWRPNLDQKYFFGVTKDTSSLSKTDPVVPMKLKNIPIDPTVANVRDIKYYNGQYYMMYPVENGSTTTYMYEVVNLNGTVSKKWNTGYSQKSPNDYPYNYYPGFYTATDGRPYWIVTHDPDSNNNIFYHQYLLYGPDTLGVNGVDLPGFGSGSLQYNQIFSRLSQINGSDKLWSTSGIFYMNTWQQSASYWRGPSNWQPSSYASYGTSKMLYNAGWNAGSDVYWFVTTGNANTDTSMMEYNGSLRSFSYGTPYMAYATGNTLHTIVADGAAGTIKLVDITAGAITKNVALDGISGFPTLYAFDSSSGKAYFGDSAGQIYCIDLYNNKLISKKVMPTGLKLRDIGVDPSGKPIYVFTNDLSKGIYASYEDDPSPAGSDILMTPTNMNNTAVHNKAGVSAWYETDSVGMTSGTTSINYIYKIDAEGKKIKYTPHFPPGNKVSTIILYEDGEIVAFLNNGGNISYARESEGFTAKSLGITTSYGNLSVMKDHSGNVYLANSSNQAYNFNRFTGALTYLGMTVNNSNTSDGNGNGSSENSMGYMIANNQIHILSSKCTMYNWSNSCSYYVDGSAVVSNYTPGNNTFMSVGGIDVDANGNLVAIFIQENCSGGSCNYTNWIYTNLPGMVPKSQSSLYLPGVSRYVRPQIVGGELYAIGDTSGVNTIYKIKATQNTWNTSYQATVERYLQNSSMGNWYPETMIFDYQSGAYGNGRNSDATSNPNVIPNPPMETYNYSADMSALYGAPGKTIETYLTTAYSYNNNFSYDQAGTTYYHSEMANMFDHQTSTFAKAFQVTNSASPGQYRQDFLMYNWNLGKYTVSSCSTCGTVQLPAKYKNGAFVFGNLTGQTTINSSVAYSSVVLYKATPTGVTQIASIPAPSGKYFNSAPGIFTLDDQGYLYGQLCYVNSSYTADGCDFYSNQTGALKAYTNPAENVGTHPSNPSYPLNPAVQGLDVNNGRLIYQANSSTSYSKSYGNPYLCSLDLTNLTGQPDCKTYVNGYSVSYLHDFSYNTSTKDIYFMGAYSSYSDGCSCYNSQIIVGSTNGLFTTADDYFYDNGNLYIVYSKHYMILDAQNLQIKDSFVDPNIGGYQKMYSMSVPGKGLGGRTIYNFLDISANSPDFSNNVVKSNIRTIFSGPSSVQDQFQATINATKGTYIDYALGVNTVLDRLVTFIKGDLKNAGGAGKANYFLLGSTMKLNGSYGDYEKDPMFASNYTIVHDPNVFDNSLGTAPYNGQTLANAPADFNYTGKYTVLFNAQDDPGIPVYRKWSSQTDPFVFYIHRKPIANFTPELKQDNFDNSLIKLSISDSSYDLDHIVTDTVNKGIVKRQWRWKLESDPDWTDGPPPSKLDPGRTYLIAEVVTDLEGADSDPYVATVTTTPANVKPNHPPKVTITAPAGDSPTNYTTIYSSRDLPLYWNYSDEDGDPETKYNINIYSGSTTTATTPICTTGDKDTTGDTSMTFMYGACSFAWGTVYAADMKVFDGLDWSAQSNRVYFRFEQNQPPTATVTYPSGTQANPTIAAVQTPTIVWNQTDPDAGTVFKGYQVQILIESGAVILDSGALAQSTSSTTQSWPVSASLPAGQKLQVRVKVYDGSAWSVWSPITWLYINRLPAADFDWSPKPVWEGDTVQVKNLSSDPDGDALTYKWLIEMPDGTAETVAAAEWSRRWLVPGEYKVSLTANDPFGGSSSITKTIAVVPLTIHSDVLHTQQWQENHERLGHNMTNRPIDFYSGETFLVETNSSPVPVAKAEAWIDTTAKDGSRLNIAVILQVDGGPARFTGQLFDERLQSLTAGLPEGIQTIHFRIRYGNGVVKEEDVPVRIIGSVYDYVGVHRQQ